MGENYWVLKGEFKTVGGGKWKLRKKEKMMKIFREEKRECLIRCFKIPVSSDIMWLMIPHSSLSFNRSNYYSMIAEYGSLAIALQIKVSNIVFNPETQFEIF